MKQESFSEEFRWALNNESVSGNAGRFQAAVNISIDPRSHAWVCTNYPEITTDFTVIVRIPHPTTEKGLPVFITGIKKQSAIADSYIRELFDFASAFNQSHVDICREVGISLPEEEFFAFALPTVYTSSRQ